MSAITRRDALVVFGIQEVPFRDVHSVSAKSGDPPTYPTNYPNDGQTYSISNPISPNLCIYFIRDPIPVRV